MKKPNAAPIEVDEVLRRMLRGLSPDLEQLDEAIKRSLLGMAPEIDRPDLAKRVRAKQWKTLSSHEVEFIADLLEGKIKRDANRPKSSKAAIKRFDLIQAVVYMQHLYPKRPMKQILGRVSDFHDGVSSEYIYKALRAMDPKQRAFINKSADEFAKWYRARESELK